MSRHTDVNTKPVIIISLLTAACLLGDSMLYIVLPTHWQEVGLTSLWEVGILLSVNRIVRLPLNPLVSWLYERMSSRNGVLFAGLLATLTTLSYGLIKGFALWFLLRCIWGIAWTFLRLGAYFTILEYANDSNRGHYMGLYNGLYRLGSFVGMLTGGVLADQFGLGMTTIFFSLVTFLAVPFAFYMVPGTAASVQKENKIAERVMFTDNTVLWTLLTALLLAMIYQGTFTSMLSYLIKVHESSSVMIFGLSVGAASLAGILQALRWGWEPWLAPWFGKLSDGRFGRKNILITALMIASLLFSLIPLEMPLGWWLLVILGVLLTATVLTTVIDAVSCDVAACSSPKAFMTAHSFSIDLGAALGPLIGYTLNDLWGPYSMYWIIAGSLLLCAAKWFISPISIYRT